MTLCNRSAMALGYLLIALVLYEASQVAAAYRSNRRPI